MNTDTRSASTRIHGQYTALCLQCALLCLYSCTLQHNLYKPVRVLGSRVWVWRNYCSAAVGCSAVVTHTSSSLPTDMQTRPVSQLLPVVQPPPPLESKRKRLVAPSEKSMGIRAHLSLPIVWRCSALGTLQPPGSWNYRAATPLLRHLRLQTANAGALDQKAIVKAPTWTPV